jgi:hypothetical protein
MKKIFLLGFLVLSCVGVYGMERASVLTEDKIFDDFGVYRFSSGIVDYQDPIGLFLYGKDYETTFNFRGVQNIPFDHYFAELICDFPCLQNVYIYYENLACSTKEGINEFLNCIKQIKPGIQIYLDLRGATFNSILDRVIEHPEHFMYVLIYYDQIKEYRAYLRKLPFRFSYKT